MKSRLEEIKRLNDEKKQQKSRLEGRLETLNEKMKELGCESIDQLKELISSKEKQLKEKQTILEEQIEELEKNVK